MKRIVRFLKKYFDDILIVSGCVCLSTGAYLVNPVAAWFVAGAELIALGVLVGLGGKP